MSACRESLLPFRTPSIAAVAAGAVLQRLVLQRLVLMVTICRFHKKPETIRASRATDYVSSATFLLICCPTPPLVIGPASTTLARTRSALGSCLFVRLGAGDGVTYVLLDCPPELEDRSLTAAMLSHLVLIPTTASPLDLWAAESAVETAKDARAVRGGKLPVVVLVPSRMMTSTVIGRELPAVLKSFGEPVSPGITQRVAITEAVIEHQTIGAYAPGSPGHEDFKQLAQFVKRTIPSNSPQVCS